MTIKTTASLKILQINFKIILLFFISIISIVIFTKCSNINHKNNNLSSQTSNNNKYNIKQQKKNINNNTNNVHPPLKGWEHYKLNSIENTINQHKIKNNSLLLAILYPIRTKVIFLKKFRPLSQASKKAFENLLATRPEKQKDETKKFINQFQQEIKISQNNKFYWLPIQQTLIPHIKKSLKSKESFYIYFTMIGKFNKKWIFAINEFQTIK